MLKRVLWALSGMAVMAAIVAIAMYLVSPPDGARSVAARAQGGWWIDVMYTPGETKTRVGLRMEGFSRHSAVEFKVVSSEPWAPMWDARMEGHLSEFVSLASGYTEAPSAMNAEVAAKVARSYKVQIKLDGAEQTIDFTNAEVVEPLVLPTLDVIRSRLIPSGAPPRR